MARQAAPQNGSAFHIIIAPGTNELQVLETLKYEDREEQEDDFEIWPPPPLKSAAGNGDPTRKQSKR